MADFGQLIWEDSFLKTQPHHLLSPRLKRKLLNRKQTKGLVSTSRTLPRAPCVASEPMREQKCKGQKRAQENHWGDVHYWRAAPHHWRPAKTQAAYISARWTAVRGKERYLATTHPSEIHIIQTGTEHSLGPKTTGMQSQRRLLTALLIAQPHLADHQANNDHSGEGCFIWGMPRKCWKRASHLYFFCQASLSTSSLQSTGLAMRVQRWVTDPLSKTS